MKICQTLSAPVRIPERAKTPCGILFLVLLCAAAAVAAQKYIPDFLIPSAAAVLLCAAGIFFRIYSIIFSNSWMMHIFCLYIGYQCSLHTSPEMLHHAAGFILAGGIAELLTGFLSAHLLKENHPERFMGALVISGAFYFTVMIYLSSETFFGNNNQLKYLYRDFAPHYFCKTIIFTLTTATIMSSLRRKSYTILSCLFTGMLLGVYCQYLFMNNVLPEIGVTSIDWESLRGESVRNAGIWLLMLAVPFAAEGFVHLIRKRKPIQRNINALLSGILGSIQLLTLIILAVSNDQNGIAEKIPSAQEQYTVSDRQNIITFILDGADQRSFEAEAAEHPEAFACLNDFTYYTNTAMVYDSTYHSIPSMLTAAETYVNGDLNEWYRTIRDAAPAQTFYQRLHEDGYKVNVFGEFMFDYTEMDDFFDNLQSTDDAHFRTISKDLLYSQISTMNAYRALPLFFKQYTVPARDFGNSAVIEQNRSMLYTDEFESGLTLSVSDSADKYFIVQHICGSRDEKVSSPAAFLAILDSYFSQMKAFGVYDDALIIVTADHGIHSQPENMPIFYIKKPHDTHSEIQQCGSPILLTDFPATVLDVMGLSKEGDEDILGRPISQIPEDEARERLVFQRQPFCSEDMLRAAGLPTEHWFGMFFGYYYTGTKDDLKQHELNDLPDLIIENNGL